MKLLQTFTILIVFIWSTYISAQDPHFSQVNNTPFLTNPAFAGNSGGDVRAIANFRTQWSSVTNTPYQSFGSSVDMRFKNKRLKGSHLAGAISMYSDIAGVSKSRTTVVNLAISAHVKINKNNYISAGLQGGINQRSIDNSDLRFDNQFDGFGHNGNINSNENLTSQSEISPTISGGLSYTWSDIFNAKGSAEGKTKINVGVAFQHYNKPKFYYIAEENLGIKHVYSVNASFGLSSPWVIQPTFLMAFQNKASDVVLGSMFRYNLDPSTSTFGKSTSFGIGSYYRISDAFIPAIEFQWDAYVIGFSYDLNTSSLSSVSGNRGGFEFSLKFISKQSSFGNSANTRFF